MLSDTHRRPHGGVLKVMRALASQPGGTDITEICATLGWSRSDGGARVRTACVRGTLHRGQHPGHPARYFASYPAAVAWELAAPVAGITAATAIANPAPAAALDRVNRTARARKASSLKADAQAGLPPMRLTAGPSKQAAAVRSEVDYSRAKFTRCPSPGFTHRYQMQAEAPDERWPSFASIPLGGTLAARSEGESA